MREETTERLSSLLVEQEQRLKGEIESETKVREQSNASLMNLLEEACTRIERNFAASYM